MSFALIATDNAGHIVEPVVSAVALVAGITAGCVTAVTIAYKRQINARRRQTIRSLVRTELGSDSRAYQISLGELYSTVHNQLYLSEHFPKNTVAHWYGCAVTELVKLIKERLRHRALSIDAALLSKNEFLIKLTEEYLTETRGPHYLQFCKQYTQTFNVQWVGYEDRQGRLSYSEVLYSDDMRYSNLWNPLSERRSTEECSILVSKLRILATQADWTVDKVEYKCHPRDCFGDQVIVDSVKKEVDKMRNYVSWLAKHSNDNGQSDQTDILQIDCYADLPHACLSMQTAHYRVLLIFISAIRQMKEGSFGRGNSIEKMLVSDSRISRELAKIAFETEL